MGRKYESELLGKNKRMTPEVFEFRTRIMRIIYQCRKLVDLPRITVRIAESKDQILGVGWLGENVIWISEDLMGMPTDVLRHVVVHEIGHAVFGLEHDSNCVVMSSRVCVEYPASRLQCERALASWVMLQSLEGKCKLKA